MKRDFLIIGKKECSFTKKMIKFLDENDDDYTMEIKYVNIDFQEKEFKDKFGKDATYPRVYEEKKNGILIFFGGADESLEKLKK